MVPQVADYRGEGEEKEEERGTGESYSGERYRQINGWMSEGEGEEGTGRRDMAEAS